MAGKEMNGDLDEQTLLKKLEEQNRLLEKDRRCHLRITSWSGSLSNLTDSPRSISSASSLRVLGTEEPHMPAEVASKEESPARGGGRKDSTCSEDTHLEPQGDKVSKSVSSQEPQENRTKEEDLWQTWSSLIKNWEESIKKNHKHIAQLVRQGVPNPLRGVVWQLLAGTQEELKVKYPELIMQPSPFERQIQRDMNRTFPEHSFFKDKDGPGQESLLNVMKAYSVYDKEVGYCQGTPFIVGILLMQMPEEDAFCILVRLMEHYGLRELFKPSMADLEVCFYQLEKLLLEFLPQLHLHFQAVGIMTSMYASQWFLTMFAILLPFNLVYRIMDLFLLEGQEVIFRIGLALLEQSQSSLLHMDMEDMLKYLQKGMKSTYESDHESLISTAYKYKINERKLHRLEKDYVQRKEKLAIENNDLIRLQAENTDLQYRIQSLEKECASLADRLIQGQVSRALEAEEMFHLKSELAKARRASVKGEDSESCNGVISQSSSTPDLRSDGNLIPEEDEGEGDEGENTLIFVEKQEGSPIPQSGEKREEGSPTSQRCSKREEGSPTSQRGSKREEGSPTSQRCSKRGEGSPTSQRGSKREEGSPTSQRGSKREEGSPTSQRGSIKETILQEPHVTKQDAEEVLRTRGVQVGGNNHRVSIASNGGLSQVHHTGTQTELDRNCLSDILMKELAASKSKCTEVSTELERKRQDLKHALQREAAILRELQIAKDCIVSLEDKIADIQAERLQCSECSSKPLTAKNNSTDPNSAEKLLSNLRATWNRSPGSTRKRNVKEEWI